MLHEEEYLLWLNEIDYLFPVSYTHLDVYKRQVCDTADALLLILSNYILISLVDTLMQVQCIISK